MIKAAFLDRDGIINTDKAYVYQIEEFEFMGGIFDLCRLLQEYQYQIVIITNQSGIGRGYYTTDQLTALTTWMLNRFKDQGLHISKVYFCPHHPTKGIGTYKKVCECRKPKPGMIFKAQKELEITLEKSLLVGNRLSDIHAGKNAGIIQNFLIDPTEKIDPAANNCDVFRNLLDLTRYLSRYLAR